MDHIQKIVEQARARQKKSEQAVVRRKPVIEKKDAIVTSANQTTAPVPLETIKYDQTTTIISSPDELAERRVVAGLKSDSRSTPFRMLRSQVLHQLRENNWNSLAINAATQGAGKSLVAANLAVSISLEVNQTVLLVDLDLRRPSIHKYFGFEPEYGLLDYLVRDVPLTDILVNPNIERLVLLPGKGTTVEASELISAPKMMQLVQELKNRYESRIVIYDLPPLLSVDDAWGFLPQVDSSLLVVENGKNTEDEIQKAMHILEGSNFIGAVLNKASEESSSNYYGY